MVYRFTLISDEVAQYKREIQIDPDATFLELYQAIYKSNQYSETDMASFYTCDEDWEQKKEISLQENEDNFEDDIWVMADTAISELIEDEHQRMVLQFNPPHERYFFIELTEIIIGENINKAKVTKKEGEAPVQFFEETKEEVKPTKKLDVDETFYGDQDFDSLEIEGFENLEDI